MTKCEVCEKELEKDIKEYVELHFWSMGNVGYKLDNHIFHPECFGTWMLKREELHDDKR